MISAIVPVWNGRELLERLLPTLAAQTLRAGELIVVDNGSEDGAPDVARKAGARVIAMGRNAGFAAAVNRGIRESGGDHVAVLNSDVELAPDYLEKLAAARGAFATGKILDRSTGALDGTFDAVVRGGTAWRVGSGCPDGPLFSKARGIWSPPWTAVLVRKDVFEKVGYLEESFESYLEDVDFGLRCARARIGGAYVPDAIAWHRGSATMGRWHPDTVRRMARNQMFLLARHYPKDLLVRWGWRILVAQALWGMLALRHGRGWGWLRGKAEGIRRFSSERTQFAAFEPGVLEILLKSNEREIAAVQSAVGFDWYWRLYFLLTMGGAK